MPVTTPRRMVQTLAVIRPEWEPRTRLRDGLERTLAFYREHKERYL